MTKSNLLQSSVLCLFVAAGLASGCGSSKQVWVEDPEETAGSSSAGKAGSLSVAGDSSMAGEPSAEGGGDGDGEESGEAGAFTGGSGGDAGSAGSGISGSSGSSGSGGSAGAPAGGSGGSSGVAGSGGSAGKAGSGGTSGAAGSGGSAGKAGAGGAGGVAGGGAGAAGSAGATVLFTPASANCASGNIDKLFAVCRVCHSSPPKGGAPLPLVTYAQIKLESDAISYELTNNSMPPRGYTISASDKAAILGWISAGAVGVPYANGVCP